MEKILLPIELFKTVIMGWVHLSFLFYGRIKEFFASKSMPEKLFFVFLILQVATSVMGWIQYRIVFNDNEEIIRLSVGWNIFFILGSLVNFFFTGFWRSSWVWFIFLIIQSVLVALFAWGSLDPGLAFTNILKPQDYTFSVSYYVFGASLILSWALGLSIYWEEKKKNRLLTPTT
jgi:hypothetical protein